MSCFKMLSQYLLEGVWRKTTKSRGHDCRFQGRDSKPGPPGQGWHGGGPISSRYRSSRSHGLGFHLVCTQIMDVKCRLDNSLRVKMKQNVSQFPAASLKMLSFVFLFLYFSVSINEIAPYGSANRPGNDPHCVHHLLSISAMIFFLSIIFTQAVVRKFCLSRFTAVTRLDPCVRYFWDSPISFSEFLQGSRTGCHVFFYRVTEMNS